MKKTIILLSFATACAGCATSDSGWSDEPVIPVSLKGIEAVNIDNSGEFPVVTAAPVKKDAYMVGVRWIADNVPSDDDKFITGPIEQGQQTYGSIADNYSKAVVCLTQFNADIPAGTYVSKFFKEIDRDYLPADVNEGFVLLVAPDPGQHSFRVEYYEGEKMKYSHDTPSIEFF
ncbi:MAG: hypothetical protein LBR57_00180 [Alistipes sp.]|jgi:hypothetical protein|nr:hypothetical protein [Alistipes sp.]